MSGKKRRLLISSVIFLVIVIILGTIIFKPFNSVKNITKKGIAKTVEVNEIEPVIDTDWLCISGERVGPITHLTTEEDLKKIFGERNVITEKNLEAEGTVEVIRTFVFRDKKNAIVVGWEDENRREKVDFVGIIGEEGTDWKTEEGITIGTPIDELNRINGESCEFYGFGWDYGGWIINWGNGELGKKKGLGICLGMGDQTEASIKYLGDKKIKSDEPELVKFKVKVAEFDISLKSKK